MQYATPVRVFWDVGEDARRILETLVSANVFFLTMAFAGRPDADLVRSAGERVPRLAVEVRPHALDTDFSQWNGVRALHVDVTDAEIPPGLERIALPAGCAAGLKMELWGSTVPRVAGLLDGCRAAGWKRVVLSNPRVVEQSARGPGDVLLHRHQDDLARILEARQDWLGEIEAVIHDLFAWKLFARYMTPPPTRGEYAGCQAYNALGYVGPGGLLYGCQSLRTPMGSLLERGLADLWDSPGRRAIRRMLQTHPELCRTCAHYAECRAGCRGTVEFVHDDFDEADPGCPFYVRR